MLFAFAVFSNNIQGNVIIQAPVIREILEDTRQEREREREREREKHRVRLYRI